jgi:hypothetical protein
VLLLLLLLPVLPLPVLLLLLDPWQQLLPLLWQQP